MPRYNDELDCLLQEEYEEIREYQSAMSEETPTARFGKAAGTTYNNIYIRRQALGRYLRTLEGKGKVRMILALLRSVPSLDEISEPYLGQKHWSLIHDAASLLQGRNLFGVEDLPFFVDEWLRIPEKRSIPSYKVAIMAKAVVTKGGSTPSIESALHRLHAYVTNESWGGSDLRKAREILFSLVTGYQEPPPLFTDFWLQALPLNDTATLDILLFASTAKKSKITSTWSKSAFALLESYGPERYLEIFNKVCLGLQDRTQYIRPDLGDTLRGLCWLAAHCRLPQAVPIIGDVAIACLIDKLGTVRCPQGLSGAIGALEWKGDRQSLAELMRVKGHLRRPAQLRPLTYSIARIAEKQGLSEDDIGEFCAPTFGLELPGYRILEMGGLTAKLEISDRLEASLIWKNQDRWQKQPPSETTADEQAAIQEIQTKFKDLKLGLKSQMDRVEELLASKREIDFKTWQECYLHHPLLSKITRRLIWAFGSEKCLGMPVGDSILSVDGSELRIECDDIKVSFWHPLGCSADEIDHLATFLTKFHIRQPFDQVHRETFTFSPDDQSHNEYSVLFGGNIANQQKLNNAFKRMGWECHANGYYDNPSETPHKTMSRWKTRVRFIVDVPEYDESIYSILSLPRDIARYVATDRVFFVGMEHWATVPVEEVEPLCYSETMRAISIALRGSKVGIDHGWKDQKDRIGMGIFRSVDMSDIL